MVRKIVDSEWKRPESSEFPKIWHTFKARDIDSDNLVEYRIQDLPESRFDEAVRMMSSAFCRDEPICEAYGALNICFFFCKSNSYSFNFTGLANDPVAIEDQEVMWKSIVNQKSALVCFKEGSTEIVGVNMNIITGKNDHFLDEICKQVNSSSNLKKNEFLFRIIEFSFAESKRQQQELV